eukprot:Polyplicarium_translucidae@DN741_c0_g1_i1.p3
MRTEGFEILVPELSQLLDGTGTSERVNRSMDIVTGSAGSLCSEIGMWKQIPSHSALVNPAVEILADGGSGSGRRRRENSGCQPTGTSDGEATGLLHSDPIGNHDTSNAQWTLWDGGDVHRLLGLRNG